MAAAALERFGRIDGLVNNAAYFREVKLTGFDEIDPAAWQRTFDVNVKGVWLACKAVLPAMRERKRWRRCSRAAPAVRAFASHVAEEGAGRRARLSLRHRAERGRLCVPADDLPTAQENSPPEVDALVGLSPLVPWYDRLAAFGHGKPTPMTPEAAFTVARLMFFLAAAAVLAAACAKPCSVCERAQVRDQRAEW